jgi:hypothetical protein
MLDELQAICGSYIKALDVLYVIEDLKPVSRVMVNEEGYLPLVDLLKKNKLVFERADFKIQKMDKTNYSDKGQKLPMNFEKKGDYFLYISKSKDMAAKAKELEGKEDHIEFGKILGYPECCVKFFNQEFPQESKGNNDYVYPALRNSEGFRFPFFNNVVARHLDLNLISHFPCNFNCKASIEIGKKNLECIKKISPDISIMSIGMLKGGVLYNKKRELFLLRDFRVDGNKVYYNNAITSVNNELFAKLKENEFVEVLNQNTVMVGDMELKDVAFMVFE